MHTKGKMGNTSRPGPQLPLHQTATRIVTRQHTPVPVHQTLYCENQPKKYFKYYKYIHIMGG